MTKLRLILTLNIVAIFVAKKKAQGATTGFFFRSSLEKSISGKCIALFCNYYRGEFQIFFFHPISMQFLPNCHFMGYWWTITYIYLFYFEIGSYMYIELLTDFLYLYNCIGGVVVSVLVSSAVNHGFEPRSGQTRL